MQPQTFSGMLSQEQTQQGVKLQQDGSTTRVPRMTGSATSTVAIGILVEKLVERLSAQGQNSSLTLLL